VSNSQLLDSLLDGNDLEEQQTYDLMQQFAAENLTLRLPVHCLQVSAPRARRPTKSVALRGRCENWPCNPRFPTAHRPSKR